MESGELMPQQHQYLITVDCGVGLIATSNPLNVKGDDGVM